MNHGSGWILIEEYYHSRSRKLLSILPPRKSRRDVAAFMEQLYVDRHASIREKLGYKKHCKLAAYAVSTDMFNGTMHCGHEPFFICVFANKIVLRENNLEFHYRIAVNRDDPMNPIFEARSQTITVDV